MIRKIIQHRNIPATRYRKLIHGSSQRSTPACLISSSSTLSPSLPLCSTIDDSHGQQQHYDLSPISFRHFSTSPEKKEDPTEPSPDNAKTTNENSEESLKDTVRRMQKEKSGSKGGGEDTTDEQLNEFMRKASDFWSTATEEVGKTWEELLRSGERKDINKKIGRPQDTVDGDEEYTGPVSIMVIDESENLTAWERMQKRLTEAPVIQGKYFYNRPCMKSIDATLVMLH